MDGVDKILVKKERPLGWLILNNPKRRNAISFEMWKEIPYIIESFNRDDSIRVIIIKGEGNNFSSGADISEFKELRNSKNKAEIYSEVLDKAYNSIKLSLKPVVAMIRGYCIGGGCGLALQCDLRVASDNAKFGITPAKRGIGYEYKGIKQLVDIVGTSNAREILFTGNIYDTQAVLRMGLIHQCVHVNDLETFTHQYALTIADNAPLSIRAVKIAIEEYLKSPEERNLQRVEQEIARCFSSQDYQEGYQAFLEKRKPKFLGK